MKFKIACYKPSEGQFFSEEVTLRSNVLKSAEEGAEAVRRMYEGVKPPIEVLGITQLVEVERGFF